MDTATRTDLIDSVKVRSPKETLAHYRQILIKILKDLARAPINGDIQTIAIIDIEGDHYQILDIGWDENGQRVFQPMIHLDLIQNKVWIQENMTDLDIAKQMVDSGVSASDIVLGLHSRSLRQFSDYAIE
jgi:XisI protein